MVLIGCEPKRNLFYIILANLLERSRIPNPESVFVFRNIVYSDSKPRILCKGLRVGEPLFPKKIKCKRKKVDDRYYYLFMMQSLQAHMLVKR